MLQAWQTGQPHCWHSFAGTAAWHNEHVSCPAARPRGPGTPAAGCGAPRRPSAPCPASSWPPPLRAARPAPSRASRSA
eukprot:6746232-Lingulodinium_polyedra.AAC.1